MIRARAWPLPPEAKLAEARWRLRIVCRIRVVFRDPRNEPSARQRLQICLERAGNPLGIDLNPVNVDREGFEVFCLFGGVLDHRLGPFVERIMFSTVPFGFGDVTRKSVKLAFHRGVMPGEDFKERPDCGTPKIASCRL